MTSDRPPNPSTSEPGIDIAVENVLEVLAAGCAVAAAYIAVGLWLALLVAAVMLEAKALSIEVARRGPRPPRERVPSQNKGPM